MGRIVQDGKTYLTMGEVIEVTGHYKDLVYSLARDGKLESVKVPGYQARVFSLESVVNYLAARRMMQGLTPDDVALTLVRMERRLRKLEAAVSKNKKGAVKEVVRDSVNVAERLSQELDSLRSYIGLR